MRVLFVHNNFPAQFGHIARQLSAEGDIECTFLSKKPPDIRDGVERVQYRVAGGASKASHLCSRSFENSTWQSAGILDALRGRPDIQPDVVVAHSGFFHTVFLRELYDCAIVNYFEYFYGIDGSDSAYRTDLPGALDGQVQKNMTARSRNACLLLDLENCDAGYSPIRWQRDRLPEIFHPKVPVIFDGVDTDFWKPILPQRKVGDREIPEDRLVVTYVSRGLEPIRGFDIFMKVAKRLLEMRDDVVFVVVGKDKISYGADDRFLAGTTFKEWVLSRDSYDLQHFHFVDWMERSELVNLFSLSDLHIYLTTPFVLSWSLVNAMACGTTVLASDVEPVAEVVHEGETGFRAPFFAVDELAEKANALLDRPEEAGEVGMRAREMVESRMSYEVCIPQIRKLLVDTYENVRG